MLSIRPVSKGICNREAGDSFVACILIGAAIVMCLGLLPTAGHAQISDFVDCKIDSRDTVEWDTNRHIYIPRKFPIDVVITNNHSTETITFPGARIQLPAGIVLAPSNQPLHQNTSVPLKPGEAEKFTWYVYTEDWYFDGNPGQIRATVDFQDPTLPSGNQNVTKECAHQGLVKTVVTIPMLDVSCFILPIDSVRVLNDTLLTPATVIATGFIVNDGTVPIDIGRVSLTVTDLYVGALILAFEKDRTVPDPLQPGDTISFQWDVHTIRLINSRNAELALRIHDTVDYIQSECRTSFFIPAVLAISCTVDVPEVMRMNHSTGKYEPDSLVITLRLRNHLDSLQRIPVVTINIDGAEYMELAPTSAASQIKAAIAGASTLIYRWTLFVKSPPTKRVEQHLEFACTLHQYPGTEYCSQTVVFEDPAPSPHCYVDMPDDITVCGTEHCPPVFTLNYAIANPRDTIYPVDKLVLELGEGLETTSPKVIDLGEMEPHDSRHASWVIHTTRSTFARDADCYVLALDAQGRELLRCGQSYYVPPMPSEVNIEMLGIDTIRYNASTKHYEPEKFNFVAAIENIVDTTLSNIQAKFNTFRSPYFTYVSGQSPNQSTPQILPGGEFAFGWTALLTGTTQDYFTDTIFVEIQLNNDGKIREGKLPVVISPRRTTGTGNLPHPEEAWLGECYPNPLTTSGVIEYTLPAAAQVHLAVYNTLGVEVQSLFNGSASPGTHQATIAGLPAGTYLAVLRSPSRTLTRTIVVR